MRRVLGLMELTNCNVPGHDDLRRLYDFWRFRCGVKAVPPRSAFLPEEFRAWMGHIMIVAPQRTPPRLHVRLNGTCIAQYHGIDVTGRDLEDVLPLRVQERALGPCWAAIRTGRPQYDIIDSPFPKGTVRPLARLILPCSEDGTTIDRLILAIYAADSGRTDETGRPTALSFASPAS